MEKEKKKPERKKGFNYMKRRNVEYGFSVISLLIMAPVFIAITVFLVAIPRSEKSEIEKRNLAKVPEFTAESYFSGEYTAGLTEFYDDTVPDRDNFKNVGYNFKSLFGVHTEDEVKVVGHPINVVNKEDSKSSVKSKTSKETSSDKQESKKGKEEETTQSSESAKPEESKEPDEQSEEEPEYQVENGIIVVKQNGHYRALELFGGGTGNNYVNALNRFQQDLGDKVQIYSMIAPLASEYYTPDSYKDHTVNQKETFDSIAERLDDGIISVDIDTVLGQHTDEDIYLRTDHHWSPLGAYYAAQTFAQAAGVDFYDLGTFKKKDIDGFVGTMYAFTGDADIKNDPETFTYYVPDNNDKCTTYYYDTAFGYSGTGNFFNGIGDASNAYLTFMGGDEQIIKVKTNVQNGRKLVIVKDSYGNAIPGYLFKSFEEIYVVDMRYFDLNLVDFIEQNDVTDLLFAMVTYSAVGDNADNLENLRTQAKGKKIVDEALKEED